MNKTELDYAAMENLRTEPPIQSSPQYIALPSSSVPGTCLSLKGADANTLFYFLFDNRCPADLRWRWSPSSTR